VPDWSGPGFLTLLIAVTVEDFPFYEFILISIPFFDRERVDSVHFYPAAT